MATQLSERGKKIIGYGVLIFIALLITLAYLIKDSPFFIGFNAGLEMVYVIIRGLFVKTPILEKGVLIYLNNWWFGLGLLIGTAIVYVILRWIFIRLVKAFFG